MNMGFEMPDIDTMIDKVMDRAFGSGFDRSFKDLRRSLTTGDIQHGRLVESYNCLHAPRLIGSALL